jgi:hypothetical protein
VQGDHGVFILFDVLLFDFAVDGPGDVVDQSGGPQLVDQPQGFVELVALLRVLHIL